ncbi:hypothetical protein GLOTRDRAFT_135198 [Gloeophyllum trabeum ATCC 11539]|uniref:Uncharacterized protein n=1 Tax=Gloeophyllum trabeum (strain ATCC 11539 / FP-39264 / Madison 617) TaxID=670483 RepID=S7RZS2_GLOTA|nr:uncharacterized protein GLOTRDRAFT_135198 [Gloeophyllum trabeum ATCC 11539]EPQ60525.1 hypothetical protein GLOTRDRAFT_135198 [Gloeophyllum trabeum ATCC 11539]
MPSPPIQLFLTTIASQPALRHRQELLLRTLQVKKIPYTSYDLASDEEAKKLWRRKAPANKQQLPGILVGGQFPGGFDEFEDAVEHDELDIFLRLNESYDPDVDGERPAPPTQPIGVPGALSPAQSLPLGHSPTPSPGPSPLKSKDKKPVNKKRQIDVGEELVGFGLQGVKVTEDDLRDLMEELGLEGEEAEGLVKGLSGASDSKPKEPEAKKQDKEEKKESQERKAEAKKEDKEQSAEEQTDEDKQNKTEKIQKAPEATA